MQEVWGPNPRLGGLRANPFQVSGGISTLQSRAPCRETPSGSKKTPRRAPRRVSNRGARVERGPKIPVSVNKNTLLARAFALQNSSRNSSPVPDLEFFRLISPGVFFSRGVFFFADAGRGPTLPLGGQQTRHRQKGAFGANHHPRCDDDMGSKLFLSQGQKNIRSYPLGLRDRDIFSAKLLEI